MSYTLEITKVDVNVPTISGDLKPDEPSDHIASAVSGLPYIVDLTFELTVETVGEEGSSVSPAPITSVDITTPSKTGVSFSALDTDPFNYTIRVQGVFNEVPFNSFYDVVVQGSTDQTFNLVQGISTTAQLPTNFLAVVRWSPPNVFWYEFPNAYEVVVNSGEANTALSQYVYWDFQLGLTSFINTVQAGSI
jgi:hypothetical protein